MKKRARKEKAARRRRWRSRDEASITWPEIHGHKISPHARKRMFERISGDPSLVEMFLVVGQVFDHPEYIRQGKNGKWIYNDGKYRVVVGKSKKVSVIATIIKAS